MKEKDSQQFYKAMEGKSLLQLAESMNDIRIQLDKAKEVKTKLQGKYDILRLNLIPAAMEENDITNITIDGIGRLGLTSDIYASVVAKNKDETWEWLRNNGHGDIIKETINAGTLKATLKAIMRKGEETIPEGLFKITPYTRASITKKG